MARRTFFAAAFALTFALLAGCGQADRSIATEYGALNSKSVNGIGVFAGMFEQAGYRVSGWGRLSPRLDRANVIVWAPDRFSPPTEKEREYLENWLAAREGRTLIYIGRDYDAAPGYWRAIRANAPASQRSEIARRLAKADAKYFSDRSKMSEREFALWFEQRRNSPRLDVRRLTSPRSDWLSGVDASKVQIEVHGQLDPPSEQNRPKGNRYPLPYADVLLASDGTALVTRLTKAEFDGSQILVVTNGSFLLNLPLVNHEHRKLASRLVEECHSSGTAIVLESGEDELEVRMQDDARPQNAFAVLTTWPSGTIVLHLMVLGLLVCLAAFPVIGRPRQLPLPAIADFRRHVEALGKLLEKSGRFEYARQRWAHYHEQVKRDSGASHIKQKPAR